MLFLYEYRFHKTRPESGSSFTTGLRGPRPQVSPPRQSSYVQPPQPSYQQPRPNSYAQPPHSTYQQVPPSSAYAHAPQPFYGSNRGPSAKNEASGRIVQICALNQYQGRWTIRDRVAAKSELRSYTNARGNGKVFDFDLIDSGGEIRVTCFNNVAEEFYELIEVGKVYLISKGTIKTADKKFNHLSNEYEITLDATWTVQVCFDDDGLIPHHRFNFRPISDVECLENNTIVDLIGVVSGINPASSIRTKNGETQKRTLQLRDMSCRSVEVTLWGSLCNVEGQKLQGMCDGANANRVFGAPSSQMGHVGSQYVNPRVPPTGSVGLYPSCNVCGGTSHNSMNCPNVMKPSSGFLRDRSSPSTNNFVMCFGDLVRSGEQSFLSISC